MNVHVSYKACKPPEAENQINLHIEKLRRRLQVFRPELVHLHATLEQRSVHEGFSVSLNLRLPSGQIAASGLGTTCAAAIKTAFDDLQEQLSKHTARLRERYKRPHSRRDDSTKAGRPRPKFPFEDSVAAIKLPTVSSDDVSSWVNANLYRLTRFVERDLRFREENGQVRPGMIRSEEIVDETIATALSDGIDKPERLALEPWLYRLAVLSIDELSRPSLDGDAAVRLQQGASDPNVQASDEAALQFHQPDESLLAQDNIPDRSVPTPEEIASGDEMISMVESALRGAGVREREAFLLYAIEGFTPEEIAVISDRSAAQVHDSILAARNHLRRSLPIPSEVKQRLLKHTQNA
jgi:DNA-directed RNA polymerase specialized sigma24 family protein/ribosome-associated translation inhibitor RaiA